MKEPQHSLSHIHIWTGHTSVCCTAFVWRYLFDRSIWSIRGERNSATKYIFMLLTMASKYEVTKFLKYLLWQQGVCEHIVNLYGYKQHLEGLKVDPSFTIQITIIFSVDLNLSVWSNLIPQNTLIYQISPKYIRKLQPIDWTHWLKSFKEIDKQTNTNQIRKWFNRSISADLF